MNNIPLIISSCKSFLQINSPSIAIHFANNTGRVKSAFFVVLNVFILHGGLVMTNMLPQFLFTIILFFLSIQDFRQYFINSLLLIPFWLYSFAMNQNTPWFNLGCYLGLLLLNQLNKEKWIGHGDLDVLACGSLLLSATHWIYWLNGACFIQLLLQATYYRTRRAPFVPALTLSWLVFTIWVK